MYLVLPLALPDFQLDFGTQPFLKIIPNNSFKICILVQQHTCSANHYRSNSHFMFLIGNFLCCSWTSNDSKLEKKCTN